MFNWFFKKERKELSGKIAMSGNLTLRQRSSLTVQHLLAAAKFARLCGEIERQSIGKPFGDGFNDILQYTSTSVILSVASLESHINDELDKLHPLFPDHPPMASAQLINWMSRLSIIEKYRLAIEAKKVAPFDTDSKTYQAITVLIKFRNALVHFKPEWHDEQNEHENLGKLLKSQFELSPWLPKEGSVIFPQRCMCHAGAKWAVGTARAFMRDFDVRMGIDHRLDLVADQLGVE